MDPLPGMQVLSSIVVFLSTIKSYYIYQILCSYSKNIAPQNVFMNTLAPLISPTPLKANGSCFSRGIRRDASPKMFLKWISVEMQSGVF